MGDAGVELQFVGRILAYHVLIGLVGILLVTQCGLNLSHEEPFAGFLRFAVFVLDDFTQVGQRLFQLAVLHVVVGHRPVPVVLCAVVNGVAAHVAYHVLGIVEPVEL